MPRTCTWAPNVSQIPNTKSPFSLCCNPPIFLRKNSAVRFALFILHLPILLLIPYFQFSFSGRWNGMGYEDGKEEMMRKSDPDGAVW